MTNKDFWADAMKFNTTTVGFDKMLKDLQNTMATAAETYPPYNITKVADGKYKIEMAVAGFGQTDIDVIMEGNKLNVSGSINGNNKLPEGEYLHKGIATRDFKHEFKLADSVEVKNADMANGMLTIWLDAMTEMSKATRIPINADAESPQILNEEGKTEKAAMAKM